MSKIISIVGARPQFIKIKPVIDAFRKKKNRHILIHTGQHYDYEMSKIFFDDLAIPQPNYNLGVSSPSPEIRINLMLKKLKRVLLKEQPDIVIVYGDTDSTLCGALAAARLGIPIAHVEAGLRSYNLFMPEEVNRVITDHIAKFLFCPTRTAVVNLKKEGISDGVYLVGDVMYDIFLIAKKLLNKSKILSDLKLKPKGYSLLTIHRQENTDNVNNLKAILNALKQVKVKIVFPVHPRAQKILKKIKGFKRENIHNLLFIKPVGYLDMLVLEKNAQKILTDSGGVQKEAYFFKVPCITLRHETEWVETVKERWNVLAGTEQEKIIKLTADFNAGHIPRRQIFGDGRAAKKIIEILDKKL